MFKFQFNMRHIYMMKNKGKIFLLTILIFIISVGSAFATDSAPEELVLSNWTTSIGGGMAFPEADEEYEPGQVYELKVGYDVNPRWTVEGGIGYLPFLNRKLDARVPAATDSWGLRSAVDLLYHLNKSSDGKLDPFLAATTGVNYTSGRLENNQHFDPFGGIGAGAAYYFEPQWYARGDYRVLLVGHDTEVNHQVLVSVGYRFPAGDSYGKGSGVLDDAYSVSGLKTIYFDFDQSRLTEEAQQKLRENAKWISENPEAKIVVEGHCDERGTNEYNLALGERRASSAHSYLTTLGVPASRLSTVSYGEERPAEAASNEAAWAKNRRVECKVVK
jgi:peptidoglycan-associated lipoprotein